MMDQDKAALRSRLSALRRQCHNQFGPQAADLLAGWIDSLPVTAGQVVAGYWPLGSELDPRPLMLRLAERGVSLALPVVVQPHCPLVFRHYQPGMALQDGPMGTKQPGPEAPVCQPDMLLVPMLAFDADGWRLGYGGGYYDRTIALLRQQAHPVACGLAFAAQQVDQVPRDGFDQRLDQVLTERGLVLV